MSSVAANVEGAAERQLGDVLPPWWLLLITGIGWSVVGLILLRFNYTSVHAISLLFGFVGIAAGVMEIFMVFMVRGWWKLLNGVLAVAFLVAGVTAFVHPGDTFLALAAIFSFFLLFAGLFDIIQSIAARNEVGAWWLQLDRWDHLGGARLLGGRLLRQKLRPADRLGGGVRAHPRCSGLRVRVPRAGVAARVDGSASRR